MSELQKVLKSEKVLVISDYREREVTDYLKNLGATVSQMNLQIGDFICSNRVVIERKDHGDYESSIIDGRIFDQAENMKKNFERGVMIIEGSSDRRISDNAYLASVASMILDYGISVMHTKNPSETARAIFWIAKREQSEGKGNPKARSLRKPRGSKKFQEMIVSSLPGVSTVISKRLLESFGSVENVFTADEEELVKVKGVGKSLAKKIKKIISEAY